MSRTRTIRRPDARKPPHPRESSVLVLAALALVAAAIAVYWNALGAPFLFDDQTHIITNPNIRTLWPPWRALTQTTRPLVGLSLAVNYALGGMDVRGYHALNIAIHALAGLVLFDLVRRTAQRLGAWRARAVGVAFVSALLWVVHPLQTESVTYTIQRAESMMGLFYLLTLYGLCRAEGAANPTVWLAASVGAYALGTASKPIIVTAPVVALLYDACFLTGSIGVALHRRWKFYAALLATTMLLPLFAALAPWDWEGTAGFSTAGVTPLGYALTEPGVILHYLKLSAWPHPLVIDYGWPLVRDPRVAIVPVLVVAGACGASLLALARWPKVGFLPVAFFATLAPTSSFVPVADACFEHRMYLPLAALLTWAVVGGDSALRAIGGARGWSQAAMRGGAIGATTLATLALAALTIQRNEEYLDLFAMWSKTVALRPDNPRAHYNIGIALRDAGRIDEAESHFREAIRLRPTYSEARVNLGHIFGLHGRRSEAIEEYRAAIAADSLNALAHYDLGQALSEGGDPAQALPHLRMAARLNPERAPVHGTLGVALYRLGRGEEAMAEFRRALRLDPEDPVPRCDLGLALADAGRAAEAAAQFDTVLRAHPDNPVAQRGLALLRGH